MYAIDWLIKYVIIMALTEPTQSDTSYLLLDTLEETSIFTFTFGRRFYPRQLTKSTFVEYICFLITGLVNCNDCISVLYFSVFYVDMDLCVWNKSYMPTCLYALLFICIFVDVSHSLLFAVNTLIYCGYSDPSNSLLFLLYCSFAQFLWALPLFHFTAHPVCVLL